MFSYLSRGVSAALLGSALTAACQQTKESDHVASAPSTNEKRERIEIPNDAPGKALIRAFKLRLNASSLDCEFETRMSSIKARDYIELRMRGGAHSSRIDIYAAKDLAGKTRLVVGIGPGHVAEGEFSDTKLREWTSRLGSPVVTSNTIPRARIAPGADATVLFVRWNCKGTNYDAALAMQTLSSSEWNPEDPQDAELVNRIRAVAIEMLDSVGIHKKPESSQPHKPFERHVYGRAEPG